MNLRVVRDNSKHARTYRGENSFNFLLARGNNLCLCTPCHKAAKQAGDICMRALNTALNVCIFLVSVENSLCKTTVNSSLLTVSVTCFPLYGIKKEFS